MINNYDKKSYNKYTRSEIAEFSFFFFSNQKHLFLIPAEFLEGILLLLYRKKKN